MLFFKHKSGRDSHFSLSEVLPVCLAVINSMCLHDVHCGSLGVIKFDIEFVVSYLFENLSLLILKCFTCYLGLPLIAILAYDML